jgi:hypothetical protein
MEKILAGLLVFTLTVPFACLVIGFPVMWLWNWLCPVIFGLPPIGFFQAVGLSVLSSLLIRSWDSK